VQSKRDAQFEVERQRYGLQFTCETCMWYGAAGECVQGYPNREHSQSFYEDVLQPLLFCKGYEAV